MVAAGQCEPSFRVPQDDLNSEVPPPTSNIVPDFHFLKDQNCWKHCISIPSVQKTKRIVFGAPYERGSPDRGDCLYIRLSPTPCFLLKHCPHISNYVLAAAYKYYLYQKKLTLPYIFAALIIKAFHYLAINFSFTTFASDGGQICNKMELDDLIFHLCLSLLIVEQLFCKAAPLINLWTGRTNSFGRYHC